MKTQTVSKKVVADFIEYCWEFYGPKGIHGEFFNHALTKKSLTDACLRRVESGRFEGDSIDRECVRDDLLKVRGEYKMKRLNNVKVRIV